MGPLDGESRRDYLQRRARTAWVYGYTEPYVYEELIALHDKVAALEAKVAALEGAAAS